MPLSDKQEIFKLDEKDFSNVFEEHLSNFVKDKIKQYDFSYRKLTFDEYNFCLRQIIEALLAPNLTRSGEHRKAAWENGWGENLKELEGSGEISALKPLYFEKFHIIRWRQNFIKPLTADFEKNSLSIILDWVFDKFFKTTPCVYEFGCGTGHNLLHLREINPSTKLFGLDWATSSQKIINRMVSLRLADNLCAHNFDYFNPDWSFKLEKNSIVYTVASLEQIGEKYDKFVDYLLVNKPSLCVHIEPVSELLSPHNLLDYLSVKYAEKRNYLHNYLVYLRNIEKQHKIKILNAQRTYIGSLFIDGYSLIIWRPL